MTSFKSAQLIANSKDADKVIFLMDRIELGTQSLLEYRGFADDADAVQATESTDVLIAKLKSSDPANTLIVTSIFTPLGFGHFIRDCACCVVLITAHYLQYPVSIISYGIKAYHLVRHRDRK